MRRCLTVGLFAAAMLMPLAALAQDPNCPPGAWFCEPTEVQPPPAAPAKPAEPPAAEAPTPADRAPAQQPPARAGAVVVPPPQGRGAPPPVVVYQPVPNAPPPQVIIVTPGVRAVPAPPPPPRRRWRPEWGFNLRLEGAIIGGQDRGASQDAGMGGLGMSLRFRPVPAFAIDFGVDLVGGKDFNGFDRTEVPLSMSGILFVNPRSRVQFYFIGGLNHSNAHVRSDTYSPLLTHQDNDGAFSEDYSYFGGHGGLGLEFRVSKRVALNVDVLGFMRERIDEGSQPEFVDAKSGRATNESGGGLFRGGLTFWW